MKFSKHGGEYVRGHLSLVRDSDTGVTCTKLNQDDLSILMTMHDAMIEREVSQSMERPFAKWPNQLPENPNPMDNWMLYQIQSMRTVSGLRGELPTMREAMESNLDLTTRTIVQAPSPVVPLRGFAKLRAVGVMIKEWIV